MAFTVTAAALVKRLVALLSPPASLRPLVLSSPPTAEPPPTPSSPPPRRQRQRIDWATLHRRTFGSDVLQCPCGGRKVTSLHSTRMAEARVPSRSIVLPPQTAPPQLSLAV